MSRHHQCPAAGCSESLPRHLLMCKPHWYRVPRALRAEVNDAWKAYLAASRGARSYDAVLGALARYRAAREAAIAAVNGTGGGSR